MLQPWCFNYIETTGLVYGEDCYRGVSTVSSLLSFSGSFWTWKWYPWHVCFILCVLHKQKPLYKTLNGLVWVFQCKLIGEPLCVLMDNKNNSLPNESMDAFHYFPSFLKKIEQSTLQMSSVLSHLQSCIPTLRFKAQEVTAAISSYLLPALQSILLCLETKQWSYRRRQLWWCCSPWQPLHCQSSGLPVCGCSMPAFQWDWEAGGK